MVPLILGNSYLLIRMSKSTCVLCGSGLVHCECLNPSVWKHLFDNWAYIGTAPAHAARAGADATRHHLFLMSAIA